jgi:DNA-directed RNA polymerase subunit RPC12/RpoP
MPFINFKCKKCKRVFDFDVGKISFELVDERPQFENQIKCPNCGSLTLDEVELTEVGQTELTEIYVQDVRLEDWEDED